MRIRAHAAILAATVSIASGAAPAMDFILTPTGDGGAFVMAYGDIVPGDAERLRAALEAAPRDQWGMVQLGLASPGGSVAEAVRMAAVIDAIGVSTFVPPDRSCASACAAVVFIAGEYHAVLGSGRLGLHSCYNAGTGQEDLACTAEIAQWAFDAEGTAAGTIGMLTLNVPPGEMVWLGAGAVDCFGLSRYPPGQGPYGDAGPPPIPPCIEAWLRTQAAALPASP